MPRMDVKIWAGDSKVAGITRAQDPDPASRTIKATDPRFDKYAAISYDDLRKVFTAINQCKTWKKGTQMMSPLEVQQRFGLLWLDIQREAAEEEKEQSQ